MADKRKHHAAVLAFSRVDGQLYVAGRPVVDWAADLGDTPFFLYEKAFIENRISDLKRCLPASVSLHYAVKANPYAPLVDFMARHCDGLDVASFGELALAQQTNVDAKDISFAGPGKSDKDLEAGIASECIIVLESLNEAHRVAQLAVQRGVCPRVALRVNPDFELKGAGMRMSGGPKAFGVDAETAADVLQSIGALPLDFLGLHIFTGSQNLSSEALMDTHAKIFELVERLSPALPSPLRWLNIGGGFGVPYFPGERHLDIEPVGAHLQQLLDAHDAMLAGAEVVMELGRYLVAEAGVYICRIIDKKISRSETFLITDGGLHHQLAASGNFGQVFRKNYPVALVKSDAAEDVERVNIVGCLCTPLDKLAEGVELPRAEIGDLVAIFMAGAYGLTASPQNFLSHPLCCEQFV